MKQFSLRNLSLLEGFISLVKSVLPLPVVFAILFTMLNFVQVQGQTIHYVKAGSTGDGSSWINAMGDLQAAINNTGVDEVWVAAGEYQPISGQSFEMVEGVKIYGGFPDIGSPEWIERNWETHKTILKGNGSGVIYNDGLTAAAVLDGFILTGGAAITGGGMYNINSSPTLRNLTISENTAIEYGGGMYNSNSSPSLMNVILSRNTVATYGGGGIYNNGSSSKPILTNVLISGNTANENYGGGMYNRESSPILTNVTISGNTAQMGYGELYTYFGNPIIRNSIIYGNGVSGNYSNHYSLIENYNPFSGPINGNILASTVAGVSDLFVSPLPHAEPDYQLKATSPVIDKGSNSYYGEDEFPNLFGLTTDLAGNLRNSGAAMDMGAYEFNGVGVAPDENNIFYVDQNVSGGNGAGNSWTNALPDLAFALKWAREKEDADEGWTASSPLKIYVAKGVYKPKYNAADEKYDTDGKRENAFVMVKNVQLYGGFDPEHGVDELNEENDKRLLPSVVSLSEDEGTILSGDLSTIDVGTDNAYHVVISVGDVGVALLDGFTIRDGSAIRVASITVNSKSVSLRSGGGIYLDTSEPALKNLMVSENTAESYGGGIYSSNATPSLTNSTIFGNHATSTTNAGGGGMYIVDGAAVLTNVLFFNNHSKFHGGALYSFSSSPILTNVTISGNSANRGGGIYGSQSSEVKIRNSIIFGNNAGSDAGISGPRAIQYSLVQGEVGGANGNLDGSVDPLFISPFGPDVISPSYGLQSRSPVINKGSNSYYNTGNDPDLSEISTDIAGNPRLNGNVDMGAYEDQEPILISPGSPDNFITTWKVDDGDLRILIPTNPDYPTYNYHLYWENVNDEIDNGTEVGLTGSHALTFSSPGTYRVEITGDFPHFNLANQENIRNKLMSIEQWGSIEWQSMKNSFYGAVNLISSATDVPDLSQVEDMSDMFSGAEVFNGDLSKWDVSQVTNMRAMFFGAQLFNSDLSTWNVSKVTNMIGMFHGASAFNGDLSVWDVSSVINMQEMFFGASAFNSDLSAWDISSVTNMQAMFMVASLFKSDLSFWDVSQVSNMNWMFLGAQLFNSDLSTWNVGNVAHMEEMFSNSGLSMGNYDVTLKGWAALSSLQKDVNLGAGGLIYKNSAHDRQNLIDTHGWVITGDQPYGMKPTDHIVYVNKEVDQTSASYTGFGDSWENAASDLADALKWAREKYDANPTNPGWTEDMPLRIYVAKGVYKPLYNATDGKYDTDGGRENAFVLVKNVQLYGGFDPDNGIIDKNNRILPRIAEETSMNGSILSGDIDGISGLSNDDAYHVVISVGEVEEALLDGFTVQGGHANGSNKIFVNGKDIFQDSGGGMVNLTSSPTLMNVTIRGNRTRTNGSGVVNFTSSKPTLTNVTFSENIADWNGGGMYNSFSSPILTNVMFSENEANGATSGIGYGGAVYNNDSSPILTNVTINDNTARRDGGGIYNNGKNSFPTLTYVTINGNTALRHGGGMFNNNSSSLTLTNVTISGNIATNNGGGLFNNNSSPVLTNVTISNNKATDGGGGGMYNENNANPKIYNSIFWGNLKDGSSTIGGADIEKGVTLKNSITQVYDTENTADNNKIGVDPRFTDPSIGDYSLKSGSPAINAGNDEYYDSTLYGDKDLAGNTRIFGGIIDMGAFERQKKQQEFVFSNLVEDEIIATYGDDDFSPATAIGEVVYTVPSNNGVVEVIDGKIRIIGAGEVELTVNAAGNIEYDPTDEVTIILKIGKKELTAINAAVTKVYDGTVTATLTFDAFDAASGLIGTDEVSVIYTSASYEDKEVGTDKVITVIGMELTGADKDNYSLTTTTASTTGDITPKDITLSLNASPAITKVYDGSNAARLVPENYALSGLETDDVVTVIGTAAYDNADAGTGKTITVEDFVLDGADKDNYSLTTTIASTTGDITAKDITLSLNVLPAITKVYDGSVGATLTLENYALAGLETDDVVTVSGTAVYENANAGTGKTITVEDFVLDGADKDNYSLTTTTASTTGTITAKDITLSLNASPVITKVYDRSDAAVLVPENYALSGLETDDVVTVSGTAAYENANAGTGKTITVEDFVLDGADKDNYSLTTTTANTIGTITAKDITLSLNASPAITKVYDRSGAAVLVPENYSLSGLETDDVVTVSGTAVYDNADAGTGKTITVEDFVLGGADRDNYSLMTTTASTTGTITAKDIALSLNVLPTITKVYDGSNEATLLAENYALSGLETDDVVTVSGTAVYDNADAGTGKTITVEDFVLDGADKDNYSLTTTTASTIGDIIPKDITLSLNASPAITKVYDGSNAARLVPENYSLSGLETDDVVTVSGTAVYENANAGTGKTITVEDFVLDGADKDNYSLTTTTASTTGDITAKNITLSLNASPAITKVYDGSNEATLLAENYALSGLETDDVVTVSGTAVYENANAGTGKTITVEDFVLEGADKDNYSLTTTTASTTGRITAKDIALSLNVLPTITKVYDGSNEATLLAENYALSGLETVDVVTVSGTAVYDNADAGTGKTITVEDFVLDGADKDNYSLTTTTASTTGDITAKNITLSLNASPAITKVYDGSVGATLTLENYALAGLETDDVVTVSGTAVYENANAGTGKTITVEDFVLDGADKDNYSLTTTTASISGDITGKPLTVTADEKSKVYGEVDPALTYTLSSTLLGSDAFTGELVRTAGENVGTYAIGQGTLTLNDNYELTFVPGSFLISRSEIGDISFEGKTVVYNGSSHGLEVSGLPTDASVVYENNDHINAGSYTVTAIISRPNHGDMVRTAVLIIQKAQALITVEERQNHIYDGTVKNITAKLDHEETDLIYSPLKGYTNAGTYVIIVSAMETVNYLAASKQVALVIQQGQPLDKAILENRTVTYDGKAHFLEVKNIPSGSSVTYENNGQLDAGAYDVTARITHSDYEEAILRARLTIRKAEQHIQFREVGKLLRNVGHVELEVNSDSGLPVSLESSDGLVATIAGKDLLVHRLGTTRITATQEGDRNYEAAAPVVITVTVEDGVEEGSVHVHRALSPNGDGINDFLIVEGIRDFPQNRLQILTPNQLVVFDMESYDNDLRAFRGISNTTGSGGMLAEGTYFYVVRYNTNSGWKTKRGWFVLKMGR